MTNPYAIKFRDLAGAKRLTRPDRTIDAAVGHARVLERRGVAIVGPDGEIAWEAVPAPA